MTVTILDLARERGAAFDEDGSINAQALHDVGLDFIGGCESCQATLAAYNAYPSKSGYWRCQECIRDLGWEDVAAANQAIFGEGSDE